MRYIIIYILLIFSFSVRSQSYFNNRYDPYLSSCDYSWNLNVDSNDILLTYQTCTGPGLSGYRSASIAQFDLSGNVLHYANIIDSSYGWYLGGPGALIKLDYGYLVSASKQYTDSDSYVALVRLTDSGDTLWTKHYPNINFSVGWSVRVMPDKNFLICGSTTVTDSFSNGLLLKTDTMGNMLWRKEIGLGGFNEKFFSLISTMDGGCALVGKIRSLSSSWEDSYVAKVDSLGNLEWDTTLYTNEFDEGWSIAPSSNSTFIIAGSYASSIPGKTYPYAAKFDYSGNLLWHRKYGDSLTYSGFYSIRALEDGNFILAGNYDPLSPPVVVYGMIYKISTDGDSLWSRYYNANINSQNYLRDIYPVYDGGYVACGVIFPIVPDTGTQDIWLLRVDSLGCEVANCTISVDELKGNNVKVFPNPASSIIMVQLEEYKNYEVEIFDIMGKKISQKDFIGTAISISLQEIPSGMFLLNVFENHKRIYSGKVVKLITAD